MTVITPVYSADYRPIPTGPTGNDISLSLAVSPIVPWLGNATLSAIASDTDYFSTDNWSHYTTVADTIANYSWNTGGMGNPVHPTWSFTGVQNIQNYGEFTITGTVNDTAPGVYTPNTGSRDDTDAKSETAKIAVVRVDVDTGLEDTGAANDAENTTPGKVISKYVDVTDLFKVKLKYYPESSTVLDGCKVRLQGTGPIAVWTNANRTGSIPLQGTTDNTWTIAANGSSSMPSEVYVEGTGNGTASLYLVFYRMIGGVESEVTRDTVKFTILSIYVKKVEFTSDHGVLTDWISDFEGSGGTVFNPRGWEKNVANNPISHTQGQVIHASVTVNISPSDQAYTLVGTSSNPALTFSSVSDTSNSSDRTLSVEASSALPSSVDIIEDAVITWTVTLTASGTQLQKDSGPHTIYVTWGSPVGSGKTKKRIEWCTDRAENCTTSESCADALWDAASAEATFSAGGQQAGWPLLDDGTSGDCDNLALLMANSVEMLGCNPAAVSYVFASWDFDQTGTHVGPGTCTLPFGIDGKHKRFCWHNGQSVVEDLLLDFSGGYATNLNNFEGCCETNSHWYAIDPKRKAHDDYDMLKNYLSTSGITQRWAYYNLYGAPVACTVNNPCPAVP